MSLFKQDIIAVIGVEAFASRIAASPVGLWMRESADAYPAANVLHLLGLVMLLGAIGIADLRVAGAFRAVAMRPLVGALTPVGIAGLVLLAVTGPLLFAADAATLVKSDMFRWKLVAIGLALVNALIFRWRWRERADPDLGLRLAAVASLLLWLTVAALGRLIAYS